MAKRGAPYHQRAMSSRRPSAPTPSRPGLVYDAPEGPALSGLSTSRSRRGATLVEALIGVVVFAMTMLGVYAGLVQSYKLEALCRYRDNARAILRTYVDQFQRLQTTVEYGDQVYKRWLFMPTDATGKGLKSWEEGLSDDDNYTVVDPPSVPLQITLGSGDYALPAQLTREVHFIHPTTGATSETIVIEATGYLISATFRITFTFDGEEREEAISVLRTVK